MNGQVVYLSPVKPEAFELFRDYPDMMTRKQAAEALQVDPKTVSRLIDRGELRAIHIGRNVRIPKTYLLEYVQGGANEVL